MNENFVTQKFRNQSNETEGKFCHVLLSSIDFFFFLSSIEFFLKRGRKRDNQDEL